MTTKNENPAPEREPKKKKKSLWGAAAALVLILCAVLGVSALTSMEDGRFASLRRWLMYGDSAGSKDAYTYAADPANQYGKLGDSLLVVNPNTAQLVGDDGTVLYDLSLRMASPQLTVGRKYAAVCDIGGDTLCILDQNGVSRTLHTDRGLQYFSARLNERDYLAVTEQKSGFKAHVSVYNPEGALLFDFDAHNNYISDAVVTPDGRSVVMASLESQGGIFASRLLVYDLSTAEPRSDASIRDGLVMDVRCSGDRVMSLCDKRFVMTTLEGETLLDRAYGNLYLHDYALDGGNFCALLLGRYQAGNICTLTTYDMDGQEIASRELREEVLDIAAGGGYLAVLYGEGLVVYQSDLTEYARLTDTNYAGQICVEEDGAILLISGALAWRYLP